MKSNQFKRISFISIMISFVIIGFLFTKPTTAQAETEYTMTGTATQNGFTFTYSYIVSFPNYMIAYTSASATIIDYNGNSSDISIPASFAIPVTFPDSVIESRVRRVHSMYGEPISDIHVQVNAISSSAFKDTLTCSSVTFPNSGISTIAIGDGAFTGCTNLNKVTLTPLIKSGTDVFKGCTKLSTAVIQFPTFTQFAGEDWKIWDKNLFMNCTSLTTLEVQEGIIKIENNTFEGCTNLSAITVPLSLQKIGKSVFTDTSWYKNKPNGLVYLGTTFYQYKGSMPSNTSVSLDSGTTLIAEEAFAGCTGLVSVNMPSSMNYINSNAFSGCSGLVSITIPTGIIGFGDTIFNGCQNLNSVTVYKGNNNSVWDTKVLQNNTYMKSLTFQEGVTTIGAATFSGCTNLYSVEMASSITGIGASAFAGCSSLKAISIPTGISILNDSVFLGCSSLESINIPINVTKIGNNTFSNCTALSFVTVTTKTKTIGANIFSGCTALKKVVIKGDPARFGLNSCDWDTKLFTGNQTIETVMFTDNVITIGDMTFANCTRLKEVSIGDTVRTIGFGTFTGCSRLESITIPSTIVAIAKASTNETTSLEVGDSINLYYNMYSEGTKKWYSNSEIVQVLAYNGGTCAIQATAVGSCTVSCYTKYMSMETAWIETSVGGYWGAMPVEKADIHDDKVTVFPGTFENSGLKVIYGEAGSFAQSYAKARGFQFVATTGTTPLDIEKCIFDETIYAANNPDVVAALGTDRDALFNHWLNNGVSEGRTGSRVFNVLYYLQNNPDLAALYGTDYKAAYQHFITTGCMELRPSSEEYNGSYYKENYSDLSSLNGEELLKHYISTGQKEGRIANKLLGYRESDYAAVFDLNYYKTNNPDVTAALGNDKAILKHFVECGMAEGRQGIADFNVTAYRANNPDLDAAFGDDLMSYYLHYIRCGKNEGRKATGSITYAGKYNAADYAAVFDLTYYKSNNPDVVAACSNNDAAIVDHFVDYGMAEGRQGSADFNITAYRTYNPDLVAVYGDILKNYYLHYMACGKTEGRKAIASSVVSVGKNNAADYASVFDLVFYKANNPDVVAALGNNDAAIVDHFVDYGMAEGRQGSADFKVSVYRTYNPDLITVYGDELKNYYLHYMACGKNEGRKAI